MFLLLVILIDIVTRDIVTFSIFYLLFKVADATHQSHEDVKDRHKRSANDIIQIAGEYKRKLTPELKLNIENHSNWTIGFVNASLEHAHVSGSMPPHIKRGGKEAFLVVANNFLPTGSNTGNITWNVQERNYLIRFSWYIQCRPVFPRDQVNNHFQVCIDQRCHGHEYGEQYQGNCICNDVFCIRATMGTKPHADASVDIYPLNPSDYAPEADNIIDRCTATGNVTMPPPDNEPGVYNVSIGVFGSVGLIIIVIVVVYCKCKAKRNKVEPMVSD